MKWEQIGKYVNTHGLKGEIKIICDLGDKNDLFKIGNTLYLGAEKVPVVIASYRPHQKYDMVTLKNLGTIDDVLPYKGMDVYINQDDLPINSITNLLSYDVYNNDIFIGKVIELLHGVKYDFIVVSDKRIIIPFISQFITDINHDKHIIKTVYTL